VSQCDVMLCVRRAMNYVCRAVETEKQISQNKQPGFSSKTVSVSSIASNSGAPSHYDVDSDAHKMPEACGTQFEQELQHSAYRVDQFSLKSCSTTSQPSTVAEKYEYCLITTDLL